MESSALPKPTDQTLQLARNAAFALVLWGITLTGSSVVADFDKNTFCRDMNASISDVATGFQEVIGYQSAFILTLQLLEGARPEEAYEVVEQLARDRMTQLATTLAKPVEKLGAATDLLQEYCRTP